MVHDLTYYVAGDRLHFELWMGYPDPSVLGDFTLLQLVRQSPPVKGNLIIAYTNAHQLNGQQKYIDEVKLEADQWLEFFSDEYSFDDFTWDALETGYK